MAIFKYVLIACITILLQLLTPMQNSSYASEVLTLHNDREIRVIDGSYLDILEDDGGELTIRDILKDVYQQKFSPMKGQTPNFGYTRSTYWFRFTVKNQSQSSRKKILEVSYALLDYISLYVPDSQGMYTEKKLGQMVPFRERDIEHRNFIFPLDIEKGETLTCYLRVYTEDSFTLPLKIQSMSTFIGSMGKDQLFLGILYGFVVVMIFYNIFLFISIRDKSYLYLVLYIFSFFIFITGENGIAYRYFWPGYSWLGKHVIPFSVGMVIVFSSLFLRTFLRTATLTPRIDRVVSIFFVLGLVTCLLAVAIPYFISIIFAVVTIVLYAPLIIYTGFLCWKRGHRQAQYFLIAWLALAVGSMLYGLKALGFIPDNFLTRYGVLMGAALQVILLSMGLADKFNAMNEELGILHHQSEQKSVSLMSMVKKANGIARELFDVGRKQSEIADSFSFMAQDQAALSEEMGATYEELTASIESIDQSMRQQVTEGEKSNEMVGILHNVQKEVEETSAMVLKGIRQIINATEATSENLLQLSEMMSIIDEGGRDITNIILLINDITDRINLLSLNASIEAARAGDHGRGFAVVADEIGKLALMTADNSKQISSHVNRISTDIQSGISVMNNAQDTTNTINQVISDINGQVALVTEALEKQNSSIGVVVSQTNEFGNLARQISSSTTEQKTAMSETTETIQRLTSMAQKISDNSEIILTMTRVLNSKADELRDSIELSE